MARHDYGDSPIKEPKDPILLSMCPECEGRGQWIIDRDRYGEGEHFMQHCIQCNGWGWVRSTSKDATCIHSYKEMSYEECYKEKIIQFEFDHSYRCEHCGKIMTVIV